MKELWPFNDFTSVDLQIGTGGKRRHWSSTLFCNSYCCLVVLYLGCNTLRAVLPSLSPIWRASVVIMIMITNSKSLPTLRALPSTGPRATQPLKRSQPTHLEALPLEKGTACEPSLSTKLITPSALYRNLNPWQTVDILFLGQLSRTQSQRQLKMEKIKFSATSRLEGNLTKLSEIVTSLLIIAL